MITAKSMKKNLWVSILYFLNKTTKLGKNRLKYNVSSDSFTWFCQISFAKESQNFAFQSVKIGTSNCMIFPLAWFRFSTKILKKAQKIQVRQNLSTMQTSITKSDLSTSSWWVNKGLTGSMSGRDVAPHFVGLSLRGTNQRQKEKQKVIKRESNVADRRTVLEGPKRVYDVSPDCIFEVARPFR